MFAQPGFSDFSTNRTVPCESPFIVRTHCGKVMLILPPFNIERLPIDKKPRLWSEVYGFLSFLDFF
jgi:hypothetical protein